jgi:hypothetical protein
MRSPLPDLPNTGWSYALAEPDRLGRRSASAASMGAIRCPAYRMCSVPCTSLEGGDALLWAFTAAGGMGLLLGLWFRVPALIAISGLVAAMYLPVALTELGPASALVRTVALLAALQFGYIAGLMLAFAWSRTFASSSWRAHDD